MEPQEWVQQQNNSRDITCSIIEKLYIIIQLAKQKD